MYIPTTAHLYFYDTHARLKSLAFCSFACSLSCLLAGLPTYLLAYLLAFCKLNLCTWVCKANTLLAAAAADKTTPTLEAIM